MSPLKAILILFVFHLVVSAELDNPDYTKQLLTRTIRERQGYLRNTPDATAAVKPRIYTNATAKANNPLLRTFGFGSGGIGGAVQMLLGGITNGVFGCADGLGGWGWNCGGDDQGEMSSNTGYEEEGDSHVNTGGSNMLGSVIGALGGGGCQMFGIDCGDIFGGGGQEPPQPQPPQPQPPQPQPPSGGGRHCGMFGGNCESEENKVEHNAHWGPSAGPRRMRIRFTIGK